MSITPVTVYVFMNFKLLIFMYVNFYYALLRRVVCILYITHRCITFFFETYTVPFLDNVTALENKIKKNVVYTYTHFFLGPTRAPIF